MAIADKVRDRINFRAFALDRSDMTKEERAQLKLLPRIDSPCLVKTNPNRSGSAFAQMKEHAILAGYMRSRDQSIRALVIYTERQDDLGDYDFGLVALSQIRLVKKVEEKQEV